MRSDELTAQGMAALRSGDRASAYALLRQAVRSDPADARAWLWLAATLDDPSAQRECLERTLNLDPACEPARKRLAALRAAQPQPTVATVHVAPEQPSAPPKPPELVQPKLSAPATKTPVATSRPMPAAPSLNPWFAIWFRPRAAMRTAIADIGSGAPWLLAALAGISAIFTLIAWTSLGRSVNAREILALALVTGPFAGPSALLLISVLLRTSGWMLDGRATTRRIRAALGWATAPALIGLVLWLIQLALFPAATFVQPTNLFQRLIVGVCVLLHSALWLWSVALSVVGLAEAHRISLVRAAASWLVAGLVIVGALGAMIGGAVFIIWLRSG